MRAAILLLALSSGTTEVRGLDAIGDALRRAAAWRVEFTQTYVPAGLETGTTEAGSLTVVAPDRLRFDYSGGGSRTFAVDGTVARLVDPVAGTCDAVTLDRGRWERLPLAALLDPAAARASFAVETAPGRIRMTPRTPDPEVGEVIVAIDRASLPTAVTIVDAAGNRNEFRLRNWSEVAAPEPSFFQPHLPGAAPCRPDER